MPALLKIYDDSNELTLDENEVMQIETVKHQKTIMQRLLNGKPIITYVGAEWDEITLTVEVFYTDTASRVKALKDYGIATLIEYRTNGDIINAWTVKVNPNIDTYFIEGGKSDKAMTVKIYQVTGGKTVPSISELGVNSYGMG